MALRSRAPPSTLKRSSITWTRCRTGLNSLVVVFYDGTSYWLADGFHRVRAAEQAGFAEIACELHQGTQQDAQWYSFGANKTNGLRRTNDDKQRAVRAALTHPQGSGLSDRQIGSHVGVDHKTVGAWREKLEGTGENPPTGQRIGAVLGMAPRRMAQNQPIHAYSPPRWYGEMKLGWTTSARK